MTGLLLCDDLMFTSRITGAARALGLSLSSVRDAAALVERVKADHIVCVLLDLHNPGLDIAQLAPSLKWAGVRTIVAFGSHVDTETLTKARNAGCDLVLPRSKFVAELETKLPEWFTAD